MARLTAILCLLASPLAASIRGTVIAHGKPVANAKVVAYTAERGEPMVARVLARQPRPELAAVKSAADGAFTLPIDGAGAVVLRVEAPGFTTAYSDEALGDDDVVINLAPKTTRDYTLRLPGGPLGGARVLAFSSYDVVEATTDEHGKLTIEDAGQRSLLVVDPRAAAHFILLSEHSGAIDVDPGAPLKGKVVGADGAGVGGARILIDSIPFGVSAADGSFTIERAPAHYKVLKAEAGELGGQIGPDAGAAVIRLAPRFTVSGVVRDEENRPLRGIGVTLASKSETVFAVTDAKGNFALRVGAGRYRAGIFSSIYRGGAPDQLNVDKAVVREWTAKRMPIVAGIVRSEDGTPVAGAQLAFALDAANDELRMLEQAVPVPLGVNASGADGRFRIDAPADEVPLRLVAYKPGFALAESDTISAGKGARNLAIVLVKGTEIKGVVHDVSGHPLSGVTVNAMRNGRMLLGAFNDPLQTDAGGRFSARMAGGTWRLRFTKDGYLPHAEMLEAARALEVQLQMASSIRGRVVRKDGSGVAGVGIMEDQVGGAASTEADGSFTLANIPKGPHVLRWFTGTIHGETNATAPADDVRIVLADPGIVRGRVADAAGAPVTSFQVLVTQEAFALGNPQQVSDADGRFVWKEAPAGQATVLVKATGFVAASKSIAVEEGKTADVAFTLQRGRAVRGKVVSAAGAPLAEVQIALQESQESTVTKADGTFELNDVDTASTSLLFLKNGFVRVLRQLPAGSEDVTLDVQLHAGVALSGRVVTGAGAPVANAAVLASSSAAGAQAESAETGADGTFKFEGLAPGRYDVSAKVYDGALEGELADVDVERVHEVTIRVSERPSAVIYGEISGIDPAGKQFRVEASSGNGDATTTADANKYRMTNAPIGMVTLRAEVLADGNWRSTTPVVVGVAPRSEVRADLRFPEMFAVSGHVLRGGAPVPGAKIEFDDTFNNRFTAVTGDGGAYRVEMVPGRYTISVGGYSTERTISGAGTIDINVELSQVAVTVVDAASALPIEQATVSGRDTASSTHTVVATKTNGKGQAMLDVPQNVSDIVVEKAGYATAIVAAGPPALTVKLTRSDETVVRLIDARDGRALSGFAVARDAAGRVIASADEAGPDGAIRFPLLPGHYRFSASANGYGSHTIAADVPAPDIRIPLPRGGKLLLQSHADLHGSARLIQPNGEEYVRCWCSGIAAIRIDGRSTLVESIAPGSYTLEVRPDGAKARTFPVSVIEGESVTVPIDP